MMATPLRPTRARLPVRRYGFDNSSDEESDNDINPSNISGVTADYDDDSVDSSDENISDDDDFNMEDGDSEWITVEPNDPDDLNNVVFLSNEHWIYSPDDMDLNDYICKFLPDALFELLSLWTNRRANIYNATLSIEGQDEMKWKPVDLIEMKKFIGFTLLMGIIRKPTIRSYWNTEDMLSTPYFFKPGAISRDRYLQILRFIRFSDPYTSVPEDKDSRLRDFFEKLHEICSQYIPDQSLCLDESLILYKGQLGIKLFIRTKRARFGAKLYILSDKDGYMITSQLYVGSQTCYETGEPGTEGLSNSEKIVVRLLSKANLLDRGYILNIDNWYNSERLVSYLFSRQTGTRGTVRVNRGIPRSLREKRLSSVSSAFMKKDQTLAIKFCDKKDVYFLTSCDGASLVE